MFRLLISPVGSDDNGIINYYCTLGVPSQLPEGLKYYTSIGPLETAPLQHCIYLCCMSNVSMIGMGLETIKLTIEQFTIPLSV